MSCHRYDGKAFHTRGLATEKRLSPKLLYVRGTTQMEAEGASVGSKLNVRS